MGPQATWFFQGADGKPFAANEKEAFDLLTNRSNWRRQDLRMLGMSDGTTYYETVKGSKSKIAELKEKVKEKKATLNKYIAGHDKLMFEDFAEKDDPRVIRAKKLIKEVEDELEPLEKELYDVQHNIIQTAFNAELDKARGNMVKPRDFTTIAKAGKEYQGIVDRFSASRRVI